MTTPRVRPDSTRARPAKADAPKPTDMNVCRICDQDIKVAIFRGTGLCCEQHRKAELKHLTAR